MAPDAFLVLLEYGRQHEGAALDLLLSTLRRTLSASPILTVIVDNAAPAETELAAGPDAVYISGDNSMREFSGWDRALEWIDRRHAPAPDAIVALANDTVVRDDKRQRVQQLPAGRLEAAVRGALVGYVEAYPRPVTLFGLSTRQWVDTSLIVASRQTVDALKPFAREFKDDEVFDADWRRVFREPSPLSENYRTYLRTWLFGEAIDHEFPHTWHARAPLTAANFELFKEKMRSLFCEHLLSARARAQGIPLVDIRPEPLPIDQ